MDKNYKLLIPKYLILLRIILCFILIVFKLLKLNIIFLIIMLFIIIAQLIGNYLTTLWKTSSKKTTLLELCTSKSLVLILISCFMLNYHILIIAFVLEIIMNIINFSFYYKTNKLKILNIGKIKSCFIIITSLLFVLHMFMNFNLNMIYGFCYVIINLQILSIINYIIYYTTYIKPSINDNQMHKEIMENNLEKTIVLDEIKDIENKIYDYEEDQF